MTPLAGNMLTVVFLYKVGHTLSVTRGSQLRLTVLFLLTPLIVTIPVRSVWIIAQVDALL